MTRVLVDSENNIIYKGVDAKELMKVLLKEPEDVTEEDELRFETELRTKSWIGELKYEVHFDLKFKGIDDFGRAVFKDIESTLYFGSVSSVYNINTPEEFIINYFKENTNELEYFGDRFNCEPHGGKQDFFKFKIIQ